MTSRVRLTVLDAGPFTMDRSGLMHGASGTVTVPSTVVVIEHEHRGLMLFDTGVNHRIADPDQAAAHWGPGLREAYGATGFTREHAVDAQLERLGYRCADVTHVVYSHLHIDHAGGWRISRTRCTSPSTTSRGTHGGRTDGPLAAMRSPTTCPLADSTSWSSRATRTCSR